MRRRSFVTGAASLLALSAASAKPEELRCDVAVIGGGAGGVAATLAALRNGATVILTEEPDWIGGQFTSQAVPPDEHPWIEEFGCTRSYRDYRNAVRAFYRDRFPLTAEARSNAHLNPGGGSVSRLTHDPRVSVLVFESMLAPYLATGQLTLLLQHVPRSATLSGDRVASVTVADLRSTTSRLISAKYFLDATELGDLLPITKTEFITGAEPKTQTGELHAAPTAQPANSQSFTFCFAMDYLEGEDHTIDKPDDYAKWRDYVPKLTPPWTGKLLNWAAPNPQTLALRALTFEPNPQTLNPDVLNLWVYRRIASRDNLLPGVMRSDVTLVNWPQNDYWLADLVTAGARREQVLKDARQLSLSFLYWMQTDAPRRNGTGWKGLRLRKDIVGTDHGLAKYPYIRESRRIQAEFTILEQHVGTEMRMKSTGSARNELAAEVFPDSVGIGCYRIDLHPSAGGANYVDISSLPFQIPLGALLPKRVENLIPACKNIGTTHITNGCYRLHPVEWNIGEAAGALAAQAIKINQLPRRIRNDKKLLEDFQTNLRNQGFELAWPKIGPA